VVAILSEGVRGLSSVSSASTTDAATDDQPAAADPAVATLLGKIRQLPWQRPAAMCQVRWFRLPSMCRVRCLRCSAAVQLIAPQCAGIACSML
jgi:hypothetical protein